MTIELKRLVAAVAAGALLVPAAAQAAPGGNGKGNGNGNGNGNAKGHAKHEAPAPSIAPAALAPAPAPAPETESVEPAPVLAPAPAPAPAKKAKTRAARKAPKGKLFLFRGRVAAVDAEAGTVVVVVTSGNALGRRFRGEEVTFDLATAKLAGVETDGVLGISLDDVLAGDRVMVQARLPRTTRPDGTTVTARKLVDQAAREAVPAEDVDEDAPLAGDEPVTDEPVTEEPEAPLA